MTFLQLFLLGGLAIIFALAAVYPRRLARPRRSVDPFKGLEDDWADIMGKKPGDAPQKLAA
ncbi:hypothetical protein [Neotabrizicola shimadae]|uniref:Uncharacterized protein n=1 Tax=Neotabrizicola shimadae TaxID=2807096 RepID=A0A8G0ZTH9_9RHOB|nr:hypothetical protein [Neotabrizicola shimadae]QYZ68631.1 hypothetical protein JO391_12700 [Neotabrizicola shimadae]